jgi:hypothetical protein
MIKFFSGVFVGLLLGGVMHFYKDKGGVRAGSSSPGVFFWEHLIPRRGLGQLE